MELINSFLVPGPIITLSGPYNYHFLELQVFKFEGRISGKFGGLVRKNQDNYQDTFLFSVISFLHDCLFTLSK